MIATASRAPAGVAVAIPVKNECERLGVCLRALADQRHAPPLAVVLFLNDCTDGTADLVRGLAPDLPLDINLIEASLPPGQSGAGHARGFAMTRAAALAPDGILLTTDADGRVPPDWVACNLRALARGADAVAGQAVIDPVEALLIPKALHEDNVLECAYAALLDHIRASIDPDEADPWPRHRDESGASIAVKAGTFHRAGGIPAIQVGEDRAFFAALDHIDARIRHAPDVRMTVSARLAGRAQGGMADTIQRRMTEPDALLDSRLEPAAAATQRAIARASLRRLWLASTANGLLSAPRSADFCDSVSLRRLASRLGLPIDRVREAMAATYFGTGWAAIEAASPILRRQPVPMRDLGEQTRTARRILDQLLAAGLTPLPPADRDASPVPEAAMPA
jgi:hypothetical protein